MRNSKQPTERYLDEDIDWHGESPRQECDRALNRRTMSAATRQSVAICTVGEVFGGVERHVIGMLRSLQARDVGSLLVLFHEGELAAQVRELGIEPVILPHDNMFLPATARRLARKFHQHNVRVVHAHGYKAMVFSAFAYGWHPFALVKTEHGLPEPIAQSLINSWRNRLYYVCDAVAARIAGATICYVTEDLRQYYRRMHCGLRTMVIPNGVETMDRHRFPRPLELRQECFNVLVVGRLDAVKGHQLAIQAMATVGFPADIHLHLVGIGPREQELRELAGSLGLAGRVHILGFRRNVYDYIAHCDALLMPSLHEGLPYTLLEAMALGTPIIASRVGGLAEVLRDCETALLTPPQDVNGICIAIARLRNDQELGFRLGNAARSLQQTDYSLDAMTGNYLALYRSLTMTD